MRFDRIERWSKKNHTLTVEYDTSNLTENEFGFYIDEYDSEGNWISGKWIGKAELGKTQSQGLSYEASSSNVQKISIQVYLNKTAKGKADLESIDFKETNP